MEFRCADQQVSGGEPIFHQSLMPHAGVTPADEIGRGRGAPKRYFTSVAGGIVFCNRRPCTVTIAAGEKIYVKALMVFSPP